MRFQWFTLIMDAVNSGCMYEEVERALGEISTRGHGNYWYNLAFGGRFFSNVS